MNKNLTDDGHTVGELYIVKPGPPTCILLILYPVPDALTHTHPSTIQLTFSPCVIISFPVMARTSARHHSKLGFIMLEAHTKTQKHEGEIS